MSGNTAVMDVTAPPISPSQDDFNALPEPLDAEPKNDNILMAQKQSASLASSVTSDDEAFVDDDETSSDETGPTTHMGYAKLQFPDGAYYMDTVAIVIGRDMVNYRLANWDRLNLARHVVVRYPPLEPKSTNNEQINGLDIGGLDIGEQNGRTAAPMLMTDTINDIISTFVNADDFQKASSSVQTGTSQLPAVAVDSNSNQAQEAVVDVAMPDASQFQAAVEIQEALEPAANGMGDNIELPSGTGKLSDDSRVDSCTNSDGTAHKRNSSISSEEDLDLKVKSVLSKPTDNIGTAECPLISIHPPKREPNCAIPSGANIGRRHAKISYNHEVGNFQIEVLGRNGLFVNNHFLRTGNIEIIDHGDYIQIADILFRFILPDRESLGSTDDGAFLEADRDAEIDSQLAQHIFGNSQYAGYGEFDHETEESSNDFAMAHINRRTLPMEYFATDDEDASGTAENESSLQRGDDDSEDEDGSEEEDDALGATQRGTRKRINGSKQKAKLNASKPGKLKLHISSKSKPSKDVPRKGVKTSKQLKSPTSPAQNVKTKARSDDSRDSQDRNSFSPGDDKKDRTQNDTSKARIARDGPLTNGEDIEYAGLPAGVQIPARRKGPGRPPKDGIMSKRERQQILREHNQKQKALEMGLDPSTVVIPEVKKPARPRKNSKGEDVQDDGENARDGNDPERKKVARPARSPSPEMRREDYTEEQLKRPPGNYVQFIHDAISASKDKALNLQQIYSAIERKYPYFKFDAPTQGWQSSVRHNLNQHEAFKKLERDGKGWLWGIDPNVSIEKDKKKRPTPPPHTYHAPNQGYAPPYYHGQNGVITPSGMPQRLPPRPPGAPNVMVPPANRAPAFGTMYPHGVANRPPGAPNQQFAQSQQRGSAPLQRPMTNMPASALNRPAGSGQNTPTPIKRPSQDVIDTFVGVFMKSFLTSNKGSDSEAAKQIVDNAIKRVLEPHTMVNVPLREQESAVINAFKMCIDHSRGITSQGPQSGATATGSGGVSSASGGPLFTSTPGVQPFSRSASFISGSRTPTPNGITAGTAKTTTPISSGLATPAIPAPVSTTSTSAGGAATAGSASGNPFAVVEIPMGIGGSGLASAASTSTIAVSGYGDVRQQAKLPRFKQKGTPIVDAVVTALGQQALQQASPGSPRAPAVEPLTPPPASGVKRSFEVIDEGDGKKARLT